VCGDGGGDGGGGVEGGDGGDGGGGGGGGDGGDGGGVRRGRGTGQCGTRRARGPPKILAASNLEMRARAKCKRKGAASGEIGEALRRRQMPDAGVGPAGVGMQHAPDARVGDAESGGRP
jgi:hypothetical protein